MSRAGVPVREAAPNADGSVFLRAGGIQLHAQCLGDGPPLLLLHGFTGSTRSLDTVARGLAERFLTIRVDLVGHGRSDAPRDLDPYHMERCIEQLEGVLDGLHVASAHVLGYSMGGRAALALCAWRPRRVRSALLVGASAGIERADERRARRASDEALAERIEREGVEAFVDHWMALPLFASQRRLGPDALARARRERLENRAHGLANSLRGMGSGAQPPLHDQLSAIDRPVLLVAGALDAKFAAIAEDLARRLPDAAVRRVADAGHACQLEQPETFRELALSFFAGVEARRPTPAGEPAEGASP